MSALSEISEPEITRMQVSLDEALKLASTTERRRVLKRFVRQAESVAEEHADSVNRFRVLGLVFQAQKELLVLRDDTRNGEALLATARSLLDAPDEFAAHRLEADVLLLQLELDRTGATEHEQALGVAELADRYRETPAEVDSLIVASELAFNLGEADLLKAFRGTLASTFRESPKAIGFLKDRFNSQSTSLMFRGRFQRVDGETLVLPLDRAGHVYLSCFWSRDTRDLEQRLGEIKALQETYAGRFEVLSFNLDELPDAGQGALDRLGLDWTAMHLPGGAENELFRACGSDSEFLVRITNANGYIILTPIGSTYRTFGRVTDLDEYLRITLDRPQYLSMVQSLRIGDFLLRGIEVTPDGALAEIRACFVPPLPRYRLAADTARAMYAKADALCAALMQQGVASEQLDLLYPHRIVALMGLWNLSGEPRYMRAAVEVANAALTEASSSHALRVARFCLARNALRQIDADADAVLAQFRQDVGGDAALDIGAACILSLDAGAPHLFRPIRERILDDFLHDPVLAPLCAYVFNRFVTGRLFRGNYYSADVRVYHGFRAWQTNTELRPRRFDVSLDNLDGEALRFPAADPDTSNVLVFMSPPADAESAKVQVELMARLNELAGLHRRQKMNVLAAFVGGDAVAVQALAATNGWPREQLAIVRGGLSNPALLRLGVFLTDERPNTFVVAPDGTILWSMSGLYQMAVGVSGVSGAVKEKVREQDQRLGALALEEKDFAKALTIYAGSFAMEERPPRGLKETLRQGTARANAGLGNWTAALSAFEQIAAEHAEAARVRPCACLSLARKLRVRAEFLDALGRSVEAESDRVRAGHLACPREGQPRFALDRFERDLFGRLADMVERENWDAALSYLNEVILQSKDGRQLARVRRAELLREHARIVENLAQPERAQEYRDWASALIDGIDEPLADADTKQGAGAKRYVDLVNAD